MFSRKMDKLLDRLILLALHRFVKLFSNDLIQLKMFPFLTCVFTHMLLSFPQTCKCWWCFFCNNSSHYYYTVFFHFKCMGKNSKLKSFSLILQCLLFWPNSCPGFVQQTAASITGLACHSFSYCAFAFACSTVIALHMLVICLIYCIYMLLAALDFMFSH